MKMIYTVEYGTEEFVESQVLHGVGVKFTPEEVFIRFIAGISSSVDWVVMYEDDREICSWDVSMGESYDVAVE